MKCQVFQRDTFVTDENSNRSTLQSIEDSNVHSTAFLVSSGTTFTLKLKFNGFNQESNMVAQLRIRLGNIYKDSDGVTKNIGSDTISTALKTYSGASVNRFYSPLTNTKRWKKEFGRAASRARSSINCATLSSIVNALSRSSPAARGAHRELGGLPDQREDARTQLP